MKKIFLTVLSLAITVYSAQSFADSQNTYEQILSAERKGFWLENLKFDKFYPINYYTDLPTNDKNTLDSFQTIATREYPYDVAVSANRGQRIYDSETYSIQEKSHKGAYSASEDGILYTVNREIYFTKDEPLYPIGEVKIGNEYCLLFEPEQDQSIILIDQKGYIAPVIGYISDNRLVISKNKAQISPRNLIISPITKGDTFVTDPQMEFEIVYDGTENDIMSFTYIDHRDQDSDNGHKQRFAFPTVQNVINIGGIKFKILHADKDQIEYMILE